MKKINILIILSILGFLFLCAYGFYNFFIDYENVEAIESKGNYVIYYKGEEYESIINWYPIEELYSTDKAYFGYTRDIAELNKRNGNKTIRIYKNDLDAKFIVFKHWLWDTKYYHKKSDILPNIYHHNAKIVLKNKINEKKSEKEEIQLSDEIGNKLIEFIKGCENNTEKNPRKTQRGIDDMYITIYFENYPAYYVYGELEILETGEVIMINSEITDNFKGHFVLPSTISEKLKELIKTNNDV